MSKKIYIVKTPVSYGEKDAKGEVKVESFQPGDEIELSDEHAQPLLDVGAIEDPDAAKKTAKPVRIPKKVERAPAAAKK
jgi:hypothetical protein